MLIERHSGINFCLRWACFGVSTDLASKVGYRETLRVVFSTLVGTVESKKAYISK